MNCNNIHIPCVQEEEREQGVRNLYDEIMTEKLPYLVKEEDTQVQEAQRVTYKRIPKRTTPRHIIIKMVKVKDNVQ